MSRRSRFVDHPNQIVFMFVYRPCSRCGTAIIGRQHRYCRHCFAAYMRAWRPSHPMTAEQRRKDAARTYANIYKRRGHLIPQPCACGSTDVEMHHPDYDRPLDVEWKCRPCHLELHAKAAAA